MYNLFRINKPINILLFTIVILSSCKVNKQYSKKSESLTQYVDPYIGTGGHGHVFVGANVPYGAVQLGPSNISTGWD